MPLLTSSNTRQERRAFAIPNPEGRLSQTLKLWSTCITSHTVNPRTSSSADVKRKTTQYDDQTAIKLWHRRGRANQTAHPDTSASVPTTRSINSSKSSHKTTTIIANTAAPRAPTTVRGQPRLHTAPATALYRQSTQLQDHRETGGGAARRLIRDCAFGSDGTRPSLLPRPPTALHSHCETLQHGGAGPKRPAPPGDSFKKAAD